MKKPNKLYFGRNDLLLTVKIHIKAKANKLYKSSIAHCCGTRAAGRRVRAQCGGSGALAPSSSAEETQKRKEKKEEHGMWVQKELAGVRM